MGLFSCGANLGGSAVLRVKMEGVSHLTLSLRSVTSAFYSEHFEPLQRKDGLGGFIITREGFFFQDY